MRNKIKKHQHHPVKQPIAMFAFFCWGDGILSRMIMKMTGGPSHVGVGFDYDDEESEIFEALIGKGVRDGTFAKVQDWAAAGVKRRLEVVPLHGISRTSMIAKRATAVTYMGTATYGEMQLLAMALFEKWGRRVKESSSSVVCSEYAARLLAPEYSWADERSFDEITPVFLYNKLKEGAK